MNLVMKFYKEKDNKILEVEVAENGRDYKMKDTISKN